MYNVFLWTIVYEKIEYDFILTEFFLHLDHLSRKHGFIICRYR